MIGGAEIEVVLVDVTVCALKADIEAGAAGLALNVEKGDVVDDIVTELSILRLLGLVSGSGVGVLVGVTSN